MREIAHELRGSGDLVHQLTLRDIRVRYKQAVFGFAWALLLPLFVVLSGLAIRVAFSIMAGRAIDGVQVASLAIKAVAWSFFVGCLNAATPSLLSNKPLVTKIYFPREVLPISAVLAQTFDSTIAAALLLLVLPFVGLAPSFALLWVPVLVAELWLFCVAAALFISCANIFFRDVKYLVQVFLMFGIFATPVLLDGAVFGARGSALMMLNPLSPILEGLRLSVVAHHDLLRPLTAPAGFVYWHPWYLAYSGAWAVLGLLSSAILFHRSERKFAELV